MHVPVRRPELRAVVLACVCWTLLPASERAAPEKPKPDAPPPLVFFGQETTPSSALALSYRSPAARWLEALPIGNGRLGAMVFGGVREERLALNESTFWSGEPSTEHENPGAREHLGEIRTLLFRKEFPRAIELIGAHVLGRRGNYGTHLPVGDLFVRLQHADRVVSGYRRELGLGDAISRVEYSTGGVQFTREALASHPDKVIALRLGASVREALSFDVCFRATREPWEVRPQGGDTLAISAAARESMHSDGRVGVTLAGLVRVVAEGGAVGASAEGLTVRNASSATLLIALATSYRGEDPGGVCARQLAEAARLPFWELRRRHVADYAGLFRRVELDLGQSAGSGLLTDERLRRVRAGADDPGLAAQFFQYGRYLLIAGSREDSPLPTNLQGIWNDNLACTMGWTCDFHLDINTQQNYWPAEVCNLPECHEPLFRLIESLREPGRRTARVMYGAPGWVCHVFTNAWGFTAPGWGLGWGLHPTGGIWIAPQLWERVRFSGDPEFLRQRAYPVLKEAAEFFLGYMVEEPTHGWLVTGPATSPENSFRTPDGRGAASEYMGPTCDTVLVRDLFTACIEASTSLGTDTEFRVRLQAAMAKLPPLRVGKHGQLMEWLEDFEEADPGHRHTSHLIALCPSNQITPRGTPELAAAARTTLARRLSQPNWEDVEWSRANLINFFARLGDGEKAYAHVLGLLREDTDTDMLTFSRGGIAGAPTNIFCIDGNYAGAAGIAEMLLQSHAGEIELLPALPKAWPAGTVKGLRARGGFTIDVVWKDGRLEFARLTRQAESGEATIRYGGSTVRLKLGAGESATLDGTLRRR